MGVSVKVRELAALARALAAVANQLDRAEQPGLAGPQRHDVRGSMPKVVPPRHARAAEFNDFDGPDL